MPTPRSPLAHTWRTIVLDSDHRAGPVPILVLELGVLAIGSSLPDDDGKPARRARIDDLLDAGFLHVAVPSLFEIACTAPPAPPAGLHVEMSDDGALSLRGSLVERLCNVTSVPVLDPSDPARAPLRRLVAVQGRVLLIAGTELGLSPTRSRTSFSAAARAGTIAAAWIATT